MKEIILQKSNFRCRENIYICRPLRRLRRLAVEYVKNTFLVHHPEDTLRIGISYDVIDSYDHIFRTILCDHSITLLTVSVFKHPNITNLYYLPNKKSFLEKLKHSHRHVPNKRDGHCDAWTKQSNNSCVTM